MKEISTLTINLMYEDNCGFLWRLDRLIEGKGFIEPDDLDENAFINARGGLELITEKHYIFYRSSDFNDLQMAVNFLMYGVVSYLKPQGEIFQDLDVFTNESFLSRLLHTDSSVLYLKDYDHNFFLLEYKKHESLYVGGRNNFYFNGILIPKKIWLKQVLISIDEYFLIVKRILNKFPATSPNGYLYRHSAIWERLRQYIIDTSE